MRPSGPRLLPVVVATLAVAVLAAFPSLAQPEPGDEDGEPGCVEANPCDLIIAVDDQGFADVSVTEFSHMDWVVAMVINHDDVEHTVSLSSHDLTITVPDNDLDESDPFRINAPGSYTLSDDPTGDSVQITALEEDAFDDGEDEDEESNGAPGLAPVMVLTVVVALAVLVRRRT